MQLTALGLRFSCMQAKELHEKKSDIYIFKQTKELAMKESHPTSFTFQKE